MANTESTIRKVLFHEITIIFAVVTVVVSVVIFVYDIKLEMQAIRGDVNTIETNHLGHIQGSLDRLEKSQVRQQEDLTALSNSVIRLNTLLEQLIQ
jgi:hypothetical protein